MANISAMFMKPQYGSVMADVAAMSQRPTFELQFSMLQDQIVQRLNKEITAANEDTGRIDAFLALEKARLQRTREGIGDFRLTVTRNHNTMADISDKLGDMTDAVADAAAGDPTEFNRLLAEIETMTENLKNPNGAAVGILFEDGVRGLKNDGVVRTDAGVKATSYADFADVTAARSAITSALARLTAAQVQTDTKIDLVIDLDTRIGKNLLSITIDIEAAQTEEANKKTEAISKLKEKYGHMLQALSIGFEANYAMTEYFAKHLLMPADVEKGSVMNLFT